MTATIIDGQAIADQIRAEVRQGVERLRRNDIDPGLAVVLVGDNPASLAYVRGKTRAVAEFMRSTTIRREASITQDELLALIDDLNADPGWHGILVQLPLPAHIDENAVMSRLLPEKDVDGLHPVNVGRLFRGEPGLRPCTPHGVVQMLLRTGNDPAGKHVVVCGRSNLVGKPLAGLLMQKSVGGDATVTVCHTATPDIARHTREADIVVTAIGRPGALTAEMVRPGAVVIDVGISRIPDASKKSGSRLIGDVDFAAVAERASAITPVPGGVGPMTVAMLLYNTMLAASGEFR